MAVFHEMEMKIFRFHFECLISTPPLPLKIQQNEGWHKTKWKKIRKLQFAVFDKINKCFYIFLYFNGKNGLSELYF